MAEVSYAQGQTAEAARLMAFVTQKLHLQIHYFCKTRAEKFQAELNERLPKEILRDAEESVKGMKLESVIHQILNASPRVTFA